MFFIRYGFAECGVFVDTISVYPSGAERATWLAASEPLAPGLFSITMPTPSAVPSSFEMIRVVVSVPLPAANGSTSVMLRFG